ncbi:hypothetical protein ACVWYO_001212 [Sphingomonas sp. UYP23]
MVRFARVVPAIGVMAGRLKVHQNKFSDLLGATL